MLVLFVMHLLADAGLSFVVLPYIISFHNLFSFVVPNAARFCHLVLYVSKQTSLNCYRNSINCHRKFPNINRRALRRAFMTICLFSLAKGCLSFASSHLGLVNDLRFWTA